MKDVSYLGHIVVAVLAVVLAAAAAWAPSNPTEELILDSHDTSELTTIEWHDSAYNVLIQRADGDLEVTITHIPQQAMLGPEAPKTETKVYPGSETARKLFNDLAPINAVRSLGYTPQEKLAGMELEPPTQYLILQYSDKSQHEIHIGRLVPGGGNRYARFANTNEVFLLPHAPINPLMQGIRRSFTQWRALSIVREKVRRVVISAGDVVRELIHRYPEKRHQAFFADPALPDSKLELTTNWLDRVFKLNIFDVTNQEPVDMPALTVEFFSGSSSLGIISLWTHIDKEKPPLGRSTQFKTPVSFALPEFDALMEGLEGVLTEKGE